MIKTALFMKDSVSIHGIRSIKHLNEENRLNSEVENIKFMHIIFLVFLSVGWVFAQEQNHWETCRNRENGTTIPFKGTLADYKFLPECAPEVLYSWQNFKKDDVESFKAHPFSGYKKLYTWRTPMGTFGYGAEQIRIKLKQAVKFIWVGKDQGSCDLYPQDVLDSTVLVTLPVEKSTLTEYILCSPNVVESWSKNTEGSRLESEKELNFIGSVFNSKKQTYDAYGGFTKKRKKVSYGNFIDTNSYFYPVFDPGTNWTNYALNTNLKRMLKSEDSSDGIVFYNGGVLQDPSKHFETKRKTYFTLDDNEVQDLIY